MKFGPSLKTEFVRIIVYSTLIGVYFICKQMDVLGFKKIIDSSDIFLLNKVSNDINTDMIVIGFFLIWSFLILLKTSLLRFMNKYEIIPERGFLTVKTGIIKAEKNIFISDIRVTVLDRPNLYQLLTGVRTLRIEADGVEGWDAVLHNINNAKGIETKLLDIKNEIRRRTNTI